MQMGRLLISNMAPLEIRRAQLKITFRKDHSYNSTNNTAEKNYCIADNIEFFIMKAK